MSEEDPPRRSTPGAGSRGHRPCAPPLRPAGSPGRRAGGVALLAAAVLVLPGLVPLSGAAQARGPGPDRAGGGLDAPTAALITVGQGDAVWERFGHNMIWIRDPASGTSTAYNYGIFDFRQENFLLNFVQGRMRYWMAAADAGRQMRSYAAQDRSIWIQELALEPGRVRELHEFLEWNARPENRFYRYHYYRDNCSTRVRDALDRVLDGRLREAGTDSVGDLTYRDHTLRLVHGVPYAFWGLHLGLGPSADVPLTPWQEAFVPMELRELVRRVRVPDGAGGSRPLVRSERTFYESGRPPVPSSTPRHAGGSLLGGLVLAALFWTLGRWGSEARPGRILLGFAATPFLAVAGVLGTLFLLLWGFTDHVDGHWNANLLHANVLHLALAAVLPLALRSEPGSRTARAAVWLTRAAAALSVTGLALEAAAIPAQVNGEWVALLAPANVTLAWAVWAVRGREGGERARRVRETPDPPPRP